MKYKVAILKNELASDHLVWVNSCDNNDKIDEIDVIDILSNNWLEKLKQKKYDVFLLKPSGIFGHLKQLYDERVIIISTEFDSLIYPSLNELLLYENKRYLRDWLMTKNLPHPSTFVFYDKNEAISILSSGLLLPIVAKTNIGASGNGVKILKDRIEVVQYINNAFGKGIFTKTGPKIFKGSIIRKINKLLKNKGHFKARIKQYSETLSTPQKGFVIFQEFIEHSFEWRCVRIGESYFAHKKVAKNNMSSGTLIKDYCIVPMRLLNFVKEITEKYELFSVAIDIFEKDGEYLINEIQCIFGQSDPYQMIVDGKPGRYIWLENNWIFEEGMFNTNYSYDLRVSHVVSILDKKKSDKKD